MAKPWLNSSDIIAAVKRKISFPTSQATFSDDDILKFANEEMMISMVPEVASYHSEYFVISEDILLNENQLRYLIPNRAIGMRLRDVFYKDSNGNLFEMSCINPNDKAYFQYNTGSASSPYRYFLENNEIVLTPLSMNSPTGSLSVSYYIRPNQLVDITRAATITSFAKTLQCVNASIVVGDTVIINNFLFTAVSAAPTGTDFLIGADSVETATNLATVLTTYLSNTRLTSANNGSPNTDTIYMVFSPRNLTFNTSNPSGFIIESNLDVNVDQTPSNFTSTELIDFLQTKPGHKILGFSADPVAVSAGTLVFNNNDVPFALIVGDYLCTENECIIPYLPPDLHISLVERVCGRILSAIGDIQGLGAVTAKIGEIKENQNPLLGHRVDGDGKKILARKTVLRYSKFSNIRRY